MEVAKLDVRTQYKDFEGEFTGVCKFAGEYSYNGTEVQVTELNLYTLNGWDTDVQTQIRKELEVRIAEEIDQQHGDEIHRLYEESDEAGDGGVFNEEWDQRYD